MIYFDNSATTLIKPRTVFIEHARLLQTCGSYGRSGSKPSRISSDIIFNTRQKICDFFGTNQPENVIFTYNATYALNLAIKSLIYQPCTVLTTSFEHNSTIRPLKHLERIGVNTKIVRGSLYNHDEFIENFKKAITTSTKFAVINHVSNAFGYILPLKEIDELCHKCGIKLILDISQSAGVLPINLSELKSLGCACFPAHKSLYGVFGVGVCVFMTEPKRTIIEGGTGSMSDDLFQPDFLPDMLEAGSPNAPSIGALGAGIDYVSSQKNVSYRLFNIASYFASRLKENSENHVFFCENTALQSGVVSWFHERIDEEEIARLLSEFDICTRAGVHCSPLSHESACSLGTVRASFSTFNSYTEVDKFIEIYKKITI